MQSAKEGGTVVLLATVLVASGVGSACEAPDAAPDAEAQVQRMVDEARERLQVNEGGQLVLEAIEAHGGLEAWYRAPTSSYTWEYANVGADLRFKSFLVADNRSREVYHDPLLTGSFDAPDPVDARSARSLLLLPDFRFRMEGGPGEPEGHVRLGHRHQGGARF